METREIDMTEIDVRYLPVATLEDLEPASFDAATNMLTFSTHPQRVTIPAAGSLKVGGTWPEGARVFCVISTPTSFTLGTGVAVANNGTLTANRNIHAYAWRVGAKYYIQPVHTETK